MNRFENRLNTNLKKWHVLNPVWDNEKEDALNVFKMIDLLNELYEENKKLLRRNGAMEEEIECLSDENGQLRKENKELQGKASSWKITASEQIMEQSKLIKENTQLKQLINDKEVEWLRNNTVWEQMPTSKRTVTKTTLGDKND